MADLVVDTSVGKFRGYREKGVYSWKGIPFAKPIGPDLRFSAPVPMDPWEDVFDAKQYSGISPQKGILRTTVTEACLSLNIWSPATNMHDRPVLFFVHGGSFSHGAGSESFYNGANLANTWDVVVVTCNYRLGALGFLDFSFLSDEFTGNCGLRDVLLALKWVHENIGAFGGDVQNITVFGQSAGGTLVSTLATMPIAKKYMSKGIIMSGGPTQVQNKEECHKASLAFLDFMEITNPQQLKALSLADISKGQKDFIAHYGMGAATYRLAVDDDLIPDFPIPAAVGGATKGIPLLIGTTKEEMALLLIKPLAKVLDVHKVLYDGFMLESEQTRKNLSNAYVQLFGERRGLSMLYTDLLFRISSVWFAQAASKYSDVWLYRFDYETIALKMNGLHAFHSTDLPYVFGNLKSVLVRPMFLLNPDMGVAYGIAHEIQHDFIAFARSGSLPWKPCKGSSIPAKCYDTGFPIQPMVDNAICEVYKETVYLKNSFQHAT
jgi:para-nitrobenzyl esterase